MFKTLLVCALCVVTLTACEKQKQASAEVGAIPKTIMDKATNDLNNAQTLEAERRKALENVDTPADAGK
jgi:outer membrane protein assembly factor BamD (BamD/ComL family)